MSRSPEEKKQTGKLKLKLKMEEGKVVKVDDSQLLPDDPERRSSTEREKSKEKVLENGKGIKLQNGSADLKKMVLCKENVKDELEASDSDASKKSDKSHKKSKEKTGEKAKAITSLKEKITEIQGQIQEIESKKIEKASKSKETSMEPQDELMEILEADPEEQVIDPPAAQSSDVQDELTEEFVEQVLKEVTD